jgi:hypothetical protein
MGMPLSPRTLRRLYESDVAAGLARFQPRPAVVTDTDLAHLPALVSRYVRLAGVVGQPRVQNYRVRMHGRIRNGPAAAWMPFRSEQHNFVDDGSRLFYMRASMMLMPIRGYHRLAGGTASMRITAAGLFRVADVTGPELARAETVTLFNDMSFLAPSTLLDRTIRWNAVDAFTVRGTFTNGPHTIRAKLVFNAFGVLVDFLSDDRLQTAPDGKTLRSVPWSTPFGEYKALGAAWIATHGEAWWHETGGSFAYADARIDDVQYNLSPNTAQSHDVQFRTSRGWSGWRR